MARIPQPWQRKTNGVWYVQIDGKQVYLGKNKRDCFREVQPLDDTSGRADQHGHCPSSHSGLLGLAQVESQADYGKQP